MEAAPLTTDGLSVDFRLDDRVFNIDVVQRAAFRCSTFASFEFSISDHEILVRGSTKAGLGMRADDFRARFNNELLDQKLRQTIADETKNERDLILAFAFSNTKLIGP